MTAYAQPRRLGRRGLAVVLALFFFVLIAARVDPAAATGQSARVGAQSDGHAGGPTSTVLASHRAGSSVRAPLANYVDDAESTEPATATVVAPIESAIELSITLASSNPGASGARAPPADRTL